MSRKVLGESFGSADEIKTALEAFTSDWNTLLAHSFQWSYDGSGLHEKAVTRCTKMLARSAAKMELRILTKQMMLLTNLLRDHLKIISRDSWKQFYAVFLLQSKTIEKLIQKEEGSIRKERAQKAFNNLTADLHLYLSPT